MKKRVAIIGNSPQQKSIAKWVNNSDIVVRFSFARGYGGRTGTKTTHWVSRTWGPFMENMAREKHNHLQTVLSTVETAFVIYGFGGQLKDHPTFYCPFSKLVVETITPRHGQIKYVPIDAKPAVLLHPGMRPTAGLIFLWHILAHDYWEKDTHDIYITGFDFPTNRSSDIAGWHRPAWEGAQVKMWVQNDYLKRYPPRKEA